MKTINRMKIIVIAALAIAVMVTVCIPGCTHEQDETISNGQNGETNGEDGEINGQNDETEESINVSKYTTTNTRYLVTSEIEDYFFEEVNEVVQIYIDPDFEDYLSKEEKQCCLNTILDYIHAFPGYRYGEISGTAERCHGLGDVNVRIHINGFGLSSGTIATGLGAASGPDYGDNKSFYLKHDEIMKECELLSYEFFNRIIPQEIYDNAVLLTMEHPVVREFIEDARDYDSEIWNQSYELCYQTWFDEFCSEVDYHLDYVDIVNRIDFKRPIEGVVVFELTDTKYNSLWVYVDMFSGEIFAEGPVYNTPDKETEQRHNINKYVSASTQYLVSGAPFMYDPIPEEVIDNAVFLAIEHPAVLDFVEDCESYYSMRYREWINDSQGIGQGIRTKVATNWFRIRDRINFKKPVKGIVILEFEAGYNYLWAYVDVFNGEVFTQGPIYLPPGS